MNKKHNTRITKSTAAAAGLLTLNLFLFAPFSIYAGNLTEFIFPLTNLFAVTLIPALVIFTLLILTPLLLNQKSSEIYTTVLFSLAILTWLQSSILLWDYGVIQGKPINFLGMPIIGLIDTFIWIGIVAAGIILHKKIIKYVTFISVTFIILQTGLAAVQSITKPEIWEKRKTEFTGTPPAAVFQFSSKENIIHIVLDGMQAATFSYIINRDREYYNNLFSGFTYYSNTISNYPTTILSVPSYMSGTLYKNDRPVKEYFSGTYKENNIIKTFSDSGFRTTAVQYLMDRYTPELDASYRIPAPYGLTEKEQIKTNSYFLLNLSLFRSLPHFAKYLIFNKGSWLIRPDLGTRDCVYQKHFAHKEFIYDLIKKAETTEETPEYKYYHFYVSHPPLVVDENCDCINLVVMEQQGNYKNLVNCSLKYTADLLAKFVQLDIYDSSTIIIHSDHGWDYLTDLNKTEYTGEKLEKIKTVRRFMPVLLVKPKGVLGPLNESDLPMMLSDLPVLISESAGYFIGHENTEIDSLRLRTAYWYNWNNKVPQEGKFSSYFRIDVKGDVQDINNWELIKE